MQPGDWDFPMLFVSIPMQAAIAQASLGDPRAALQSLDPLIERYREGGHPIVNGQIYEARAQIALAADLREELALSLARMEQHYRPTGTPALIAKCERMLELASPQRSRPRQDSTRTPSPRLPADVLTPNPDKRAPDKPLEEVTVAAPRRGKRGAES
jgi:hypothetical protein